MDLKPASPFRRFLRLREGAEAFDQPHVISADPPMKLPDQIVRLAEVLKKGREVSIGKEVDPKGGERDVTLKPRKLYVVGEAVADYLLGRTPGRYDLVTDAHPDEVEKLCRHHRPPIDVLRADKGKGWVRVRVGGKDYDVHTLRGAKGYTADLKEDAQRRDFTLEALYYDVLGKKVIDPVGGIGHLRDGVVRFVGSPAAKVEADPGVLFRYARWAAGLPNGRADDEGRAAVEKHLGDDLPAAKIRDGFLVGLDDPAVDPVRYVAALEKLGLLEVAFPGMRVNQSGLLGKLAKARTRPIALAAILAGNDPGDVATRLKEIGYTQREVHDVVFLLNLLRFRPEFAPEFRRRAVHTSLTRRQVGDWAKANGLDQEAVVALMDRDEPGPKPWEAAKPAVGPEPSGRSGPPAAGA